MSREVLLAARGISVTLRGRKVLDRVDLSVSRGEIVTLIGPNGAGKSTLVRVVLGLLRPDAGKVERAQGLRIGYMPQKLHVDPVLPLTVERFLTLARPAPPERLEAVLREVGAAALKEAPLQALSGGETQRVLLARAMLREPDLLVLDEPVQGVDITGQEELYRLIGAIRRRHGCAILMVSHDLHLVMRATDRVVCLNHHVCCSGTPGTVQADPSYAALFGQPTLLTPYTHRHDHRHDSHGNIVRNHDHG